MDNQLRHNCSLPGNNWKFRIIRLIKHCYASLMLRDWVEFYWVEVAQIILKDICSGQADPLHMLLLFASRRHSPEGELLLARRAEWSLSMGFKVLPPCDLSNLFCEGKIEDKLETSNSSVQCFPDKLSVSDLSCRFGNPCNTTFESVCQTLSTYEAPETGTRRSSKSSLQKHLIPISLTWPSVVWYGDVMAGQDVLEIGCMLRDV